MIGGTIAQLVEQRTENPCVAGSIPAGTTEQKADPRRSALLFLIPYSGFLIPDSGWSVMTFSVLSSRLNLISDCLLDISRIHYFRHCHLISLLDSRLSFLLEKDSIPRLNSPRRVQKFTVLSSRVSVCIRLTSVDRFARRFAGNSN